MHWIYLPTYRSFFHLNFRRCDCLQPFGTCSCLHHHLQQRCNIFDQTRTMKFSWWGVWFFAKVLICAEFSCSISVSKGLLQPSSVSAPLSISESQRCIISRSPLFAIFDLHVCPQVPGCSLHLFEMKNLSKSIFT